MILGLSLDPRLGPLTSGGERGGGGAREAVPQYPQGNSRGVGLAGCASPLWKLPAIKAVHNEFDELGPHIKLSSLEP